MYFSRRHTRSAFTLMEMLVVIAILGLLVGTVAVSMQGHMARARISTAKAEIVRLTEALDFFSGTNARYPTTDEGLEILTAPGGNKEDEYISARDLNDPWGSAYEYVVPGPNNEPFELISAGPDGQFESEDDLSNLTLGDE